MNPALRRGGPGQETAPTSSQSQEYGRSLDSAIEHAGSDWWAEGCLLAIKQLAMTGRGFDVDHVLDMVGQPPSPECLGAVVAAAYRAKIIEPVGCRVGRGNRLVRIWWGCSS